MSEYPTLPRAPILEALVDIRIRASRTVDIDSFSTFARGLEARFPAHRQMTVFTGGIHQEGSRPPETIPIETETNGMQFLSDSRAVQCRRDGFTFSRLNGYDNWSNFVSEAQELWSRYDQIVPITSITRIALRYINRIRVPVPGDYADVFQTVPQIAKSIDNGLASFMMRLVMPQENDIQAVVTLATEPQLEPTTSLVIFDIDVFRQNLDLPAGDDLWTICNALRLAKNRIFFESLTPQTLENYK